MALRLVFDNDAILSNLQGFPWLKKLLEQLGCRYTVAALPAPTFGDTVAPSRLRIWMLSTRRSLLRRRLPRNPTDYTVTISYQRLSAFDLFVKRINSANGCYEGILWASRFKVSMCITKVFTEMIKLFLAPTHPVHPAFLSYSCIPLQLVMFALELGSSLAPRTHPHRHYTI